MQRLAASVPSYTRHARRPQTEMNPPCRHGRELPPRVEDRVIRYPRAQAWSRSGFPWQRSARVKLLRIPGIFGWALPVLMLVARSSTCSLQRSPQRLIGGGPAVSLGGATGWAGGRRQPARPDHSTSSLGTLKVGCQCAPVRLLIQVALPVAS